MIEERPAFAIEKGWIYVDHPAADPGWCEVIGNTVEGIWASFDRGRAVPYVVHRRKVLRWSPGRPDGVRAA